MKTKSVSITKVNGDSFSETVQDKIVNESPLQIMMMYGDVNNRKTENLSVTMRTQGDDFNLVKGFLFCEGIIKSAEDIVSIKHIDAEENIMLVELSPNVLFNPNDKKRNFIASSACGFCGKSINDIALQSLSSINSV
jgi:FdhD protein